MIKPTFRRALSHLLFVTTILLPYAQHAHADVQTVFVGTYTSGESRGIYAFEFNNVTGEADSPRLVAETQNPSFLALHPDGHLLYAVNETDEFKGEPGGGITAFHRAESGSLEPLNWRSTRGGSPCHLSVDDTGKCVLVANYGGGSVISYPILPDGQLGLPASFIQHQGSSVNPQRQTAPHAHGIYLTKNQRFALVPDLGLDQLLIYRFQASTAQLESSDPAFARLKPGAGPRHLAMHPDGASLFVLNELDSTIATFRFDPTTGTATTLSTVSTLPDGFDGNNSTAEIFVHPNGRFVYASNRGHDSIAVFECDAATRRLTPIGHHPTAGETPRSFCLSPDGRWLLAANQNSGTISIHRVDPDSGTLRRLDAMVRVPNPVCLVFSPAL